MIERPFRATASELWNLVFGDIFFCPDFKERRVLEGEGDESLAFDFAARIGVRGELLMAATNCIIFFSISLMTLFLACMRLLFSVTL